MFGLNNFIDSRNNYFRGRLKKDRFYFIKGSKALNHRGLAGVKIKSINHKILRVKAKSRSKSKSKAINHEDTKGKEVRLRPKTYKIIL